MTLIDWIVLLGNPLWTAMAHAGMNRLPAACKLPRQALTVLAILVLVPIQIAFAFLTGGELSRLLFFGLLALLTGHVYFHIFNMSETARRIQILIRIKKRQGAAGSSGMESYSSEEILKVRLGRLVELRQVKVREGKYHWRASILLVASVILKMYERILFPNRAQMSTGLPHSSVRALS